MKRILALLLLSAIATGAWGQDEVSSSDPAATEQIHEQLRALRDRMLKSYEARDVDALLKDVEPNVVVTWQNADRNLNHAEFLEFYRDMVGGESSVVKEMSSNFVADGESLIYGDDTAIAYGTCTDHFVLSDGSELDLTSKWTATAVKTGEDWKVASFHMSSSIFDNPVLSAANGWLVKIGIIGGVIGLIVGFVVAYLICKRKTESAT